MENPRVITGESEFAVLEQLKNDFKFPEKLLDYSAEIHLGNRILYLQLDVDLGGGFESGYAFTTLQAPFSDPNGFRFALYPQDFLAGIGKLFGMQDVKVGFPDFDRKFIIKSNQSLKVKQLLADNAIREKLQQMQHFKFEIAHIDASEARQTARLELTISEAVTDPKAIEDLVFLMIRTLKKLEPVVSEP
jgi:hypothetical protein